METLFATCYQQTVQALNELKIDDESNSGDLLTGDQDEDLEATPNQQFQLINATPDTVVAAFIELERFIITDYQEIKQLLLKNQQPSKKHAKKMPQQQQENQHHEKPRAKGNCFNCRKAGHLRNRCTKPRQFEHNSGQQFNRQHYHQPDQRQVQGHQGHSGHQNAQPFYQNVMPSQWTQQLPVQQYQHNQHFTNPTS